MNARQFVAAVAVSTILLNGVGFVRTGSAQPVPPSASAPSASHTPEATPPRVSYLDGDVSFWRPGGQDWAPAMLNTALAPGDTLYTGQRANVEIQIGPRAFVRAAERTQIGLDNQELDFVQLRVTAGNAALDIRELPSGHTVELGTPNAAITIERTGYYRVAVADDSVRLSTHRGGSATITPASGGATPIAANQEAVVIGSDPPRVEFGPAPALTAWDHWNYQRSAALLQPPAASYVSSGVYGAQELDRYGTWRTVDPYGPIWTPRAVASDWVPYSTGRWMWDPVYGWTWLDDAPWGWAPYHYGRWVFVDRAWAWAPGPVVVRPVYAPALVAFFGGVSVSVGRPVAWAPLGWGEPVTPWWGRRGFVGVPSWRGWGGPRVVNNVVVDRSSVVNVQNITVYKNAHVVNAVVGVPAERFGRERVEPARRLRQTDVKQLAPIRGPLDVRPVAASVMPAVAPASKPPDAIRHRRIVATRPPLDVAPMLRAHGLREDSDTNRSSTPRLVPSPRSTDRAGTPPARQEARPSSRDVPTPGNVQPRERPRSDGDALRERSRPDANASRERSRTDAEVPRAERERRAVETAPPPPAPRPSPDPAPSRDRAPSRNTAPANGARPDAPPSRVERPSPAEPPARRLERAEPPRDASPPQRTPDAPSPRVERRPARTEPPGRVEPTPRVERRGGGDAHGSAAPGPPRVTPQPPPPRETQSPPAPPRVTSPPPPTPPRVTSPPAPAPTRDAPPPAARRPQAPPPRVERPALEPPPRQRPERAEGSKRAERSGDGREQRHQ